MYYTSSILIILWLTDFLKVNHPYNDYYVHGKKTTISFMYHEFLDHMIDQVNQIKIFCQSTSTQLLKNMPLCKIISEKIQYLVTISQQPSSSPSSSFVTKTRS